MYLASGSGMALQYSAVELNDYGETPTYIGKIPDIENQPVWVIMTVITQWLCLHKPSYPINNLHLETTKIGKS